MGMVPGKPIMLNNLEWRLAQSHLQTRWGSLLRLPWDMGPIARNELRWASYCQYSSIAYFDSMSLEYSSWIRLVEHVSAPSLCYVTWQLIKLSKQNRMDKKFYRPAAIQRWVVLVYDSRFSNDDQRRMITSFLRACDELGTRWSSARGMILILNTFLIGISVQRREPVVVNASPHANHEEQFKNAGNQCVTRLGGLPSLVVAVLPGNAAEVYKAIK